MFFRKRENEYKSVSNNILNSINNINQKYEKKKTWKRKSYIFFFFIFSFILYGYYLFLNNNLTFSKKEINLIITYKTKIEKEKDSEIALGLIKEHNSYNKLNIDYNSTKIISIPVIYDIISKYNSKNNSNNSSNNNDINHSTIVNVSNVNVSNVNVSNVMENNNSRLLLYLDVQYKENLLNFKANIKII